MVNSCGEVEGLCCSFALGFEANCRVVVPSPGSRATWPGHLCSSENTLHCGKKTLSGGVGSGTSLGDVHTLQSLA